MDPAPDPDAQFRILVVCTANICRSVMAEHFLRRDAATLGLPGVEIASCGLLFDGEPASTTVVEVLAERDLDAREHRSRKFTPEFLTGVDLVVTMERLHARELAVALEGASSRVHTLGSIVDWLKTTEGITGSPAERVAAFAAGRRPSDLLGSGPDEVPDPHGRSKRVHRKAADRLDGMCRALLEGLYDRVASD